MPTPIPVQPTTTLPEAVINWLSSDAVTQIIIQLDKKLGILPGDFETLPALIIDIASKKINPEQASDELQKRLSFIKPENAGASIATIKERVFKPIAGGLKAIGVDVDRIDSKGAKPFYLEAVPEAPKATVLEFEKAPTRQTTESATTEGKTAPVGPSATVAEARKPFMLHEESSTPAPANPKLGQFAEGSIASRPTPRVDNFTFKTPVASRPEENPRPTAVQFGSSFESLSFNRANQPLGPAITQTPPATPKVPSAPTVPTSNSSNTPRVIHYTKFRTALPPSETTNEKMLSGKKI